MQFTESQRLDLKSNACQLYIMLSGHCTSKNICHANYCKMYVTDWHTKDVQSCVCRCDNQRICYNYERRKSRMIIPTKTAPRREFCSFHGKTHAGIQQQYWPSLNHNYIYIHTCMQIWKINCLKLFTNDSLSRRHINWPQYWMKCISSRCNSKRFIQFISLKNGMVWYSRV